MNFQIKHRTVTCPPDLEREITHKATRFKRVLPEPAFLELQLKQLAKAQNGGDKEVEIIADIPEKSVIRFVAQGTTFLEAVDKVFDRLDEHVSQERDRQHDHSLHGKPPKEWLADELAKSENPQP